MKRESHTRSVTLAALAIGVLLSMTACGEMLQRRADVEQPSGADPALESKFGLTADAQDPSERDKELGYGRWKAKPEPTGTDSPTSPDRRKGYGGSGDQ